MTEILQNVQVFAPRLRRCQSYDNTSSFSSKTAKLKKYIQDIFLGLHCPTDPKCLWEKYHQISDDLANKVLKLKMYVIQNTYMYVLCIWDNKIYAWTCLHFGLTVRALGVGLGGKLKWHEG